MQKLKIVADYVPSYKYLNVCLKDGNNCGRFEKCVRTMTVLDALGKLDYYREVFDVDYYNSHKTWYMKKMLKRIARKKHDYFEIYAFKKIEFKNNCYWTNFGGLIRDYCKIRIENNKLAEFSQATTDVLYKYDCGICF